jgi:UPF0716 protein FxsA
VLLRLGCLFVLVPLVELGLLIWMGQVMGFWPTFALVAATGVFGAALARREGTRALSTVQHDLAAGRLPAQALMSGAAVLVGGAFLVTPGVLTDVVGLLLLLPPTRSAVLRWLRRGLEGALARGTLQMSVWRIGGVGRRSGRHAASDAHGRDAGFSFEFGSGADQGRKTDDESPPARPGEIIQD